MPASDFGLEGSIFDPARVLPYGVFGSAWYLHNGLTRCVDLTLVADPPTHFGHKGSFPLRGASAQYT